MRRTGWFTAAVVAAALYSSAASAGVWFEVLNAPCFSGNPFNQNPNPTNVTNTNLFPGGSYVGSFDCFNRDFNGDGSRTTLSIKAFQVWEYGTMFLYYDVTDPWNSANATGTSNEHGGFFGGISVTISPKRVAEKITGKEIKIPFLNDIELKYELENVSKFGSLNYYGIQWSINQPFLDFFTVTTQIRDDQVFEGIDLQLGFAWQKSFSLAVLDFQFSGFLAWGVFGEGAGVGAFAGTTGHPFMVSQPQLLLDVGKLAQFSPAKIYLGIEWQFAFNRYLIPAKSEHTLQYMLKWNI